MPADIVMPKASLTMTEGTLIEWLRQDGELIHPGDHVANIETDKVVLPVEVDSKGTLVQVLEAGETVPIATVIGYILADGETRADIPVAEADPAQSEKRMQPAATVRRTRQAQSGEIIISPLARKVARDLGVDPTGMADAGYSGKISADDVREYAERLAALEGNTGGSAADVENLPQVSASIPLAGVRGLIAERMAASAHSSAAVTLHTEVDAAALIRLRKVVNDSHAANGLKLSFDALIAKAAAQALREHPRLNARMSDDRIEELEKRNIAVAVDAPQGLYTVVLRDADEKSLEEIAMDLGAMVSRVLDGKPAPQDLEGSTFTITNLGQTGVTFFTPIIQPGQCAILGVGSVTERLQLEGERVVQKMFLALSLTFDHRMIDGAPAARFLADVCDNLQDAEVRLQ